MKKLILITILLLAILSSCSSKVDFSPRPVNYDRDVCHTCKMGLDNPKYNLQAINENGQIRWYDDLGCLAEDMRDGDFNQWKGQKYKIWIGDAETGQWIDAEKAWYRFGDRTPMGYGYGALKHKTNAAKYDFKTTIQRINEGKTKRADFIKKKKMSISGKDAGGSGMKCAPGKCGK